LSSTRRRGVRCWSPGAVSPSAVSSG
jgi:hypothetical protein